ncbi:NAD(P)-binding protein [Cupriavidus plantarum]|uniref:NAD(P)-binding protein n=1 Tax=Cupriavidus plantarum TaxID=942865 RepID=UPI0015C83CBB|nr:FAD/NAD(P)-binding protein [Cupriavidus plantarum]NYI00031.1 spermidine dehydrogenase [Cupriavidus plantarum]
MTITRRDFLNGTALTIAAGLGPAALLRAADADAATAAYPPALTGLRGNHAGTFTLAHSLAREGAAYPTVLAQEAYDLVVVGGGLSGLAAAWFYRRKFGPKARILILDNHDDFGGHAKRNEFTVRGRKLVTYGGSADMPASAAGNAAVRTLLGGLGLDATRAPALAQTPFAALGMGRAVFFDADHFGQDRFVPGDPFAALIDARVGTSPGGGTARPALDTIRAHLDAAPLGAADRAALLRLAGADGGIASTATRTADAAGAASPGLASGAVDYLAGMAPADRAAYLARTRYATFLRERAGVGLGGLRFLRSRSNDAYALDADGISVAEAISIGLPAGAGMPAPALDQRLGKSPASRLWFPDGNASLARLLVRDLVPGVASSAGKPEDIGRAVFDASFDYGRLDREGNAVRIRLEATAIAVEPDTRITRVTYGWRGNLHRVEAQHVVLAGYNMMIPFIFPSLPAPQKEALRAEVKAPMIYTKVALDHWRAFAALKAWRIHAPAMAYTDLWLERPVAGSLSAAATPDDPAVLHMLYVPTVPDSGMSVRERFRAGRALLLGTPYDDLERGIRAQLDRMLGPAGFASRDVVRGITVNRWAHGYSYMSGTLSPDDAALQTALAQAGKGLGNVRIANSDSAGSPSLTAAVEQAWRAVDGLAAIG